MFKVDGNIKKYCISKKQNNTYQWASCVSIQQKKNEYGPMIYEKLMNNSKNSILYFAEL
jgi:hypothetical protein